jgi:hypothetical protein
MIYPYPHVDVIDRYGWHNRRRNRWQRRLNHDLKWYSPVYRRRSPPTSASKVGTYRPKPQSSYAPK